MNQYRFASRLSSNCVSNRESTAWAFSNSVDIKPFAEVSESIEARRELVCHHPTTWSSLYVQIPGWVRGEFDWRFFWVGQQSLQ